MHGETRKGMPIMGMKKLFFCQDTSSYGRNSRSAGVEAVPDICLKCVRL